MTTADPSLFVYKLTDNTKKWINEFSQILTLTEEQKNILEEKIKENKLEIIRQKYKIDLVCYDGEFTEYLQDDFKLLVCCSCNKYFVDEFEKCDYCNKGKCYNCSAYATYVCQNAKYCEKCEDPLLFETECDCGESEESEENENSNNVVLSKYCAYCGDERFNMQDDQSLNSYIRGEWYHHLGCLNSHLEVLQKKSDKKYKKLLKHKLKILKDVPGNYLKYL